MRAASHRGADGRPRTPYPGRRAAVPRRPASQASVTLRPPAPERNRSTTRTRPLTTNGTVPGTVSRPSAAPELALGQDGQGVDVLVGRPAGLHVLPFGVLGQDEVRAVKAEAGRTTPRTHRSQRRGWHADGDADLVVTGPLLCADSDPEAGADG
ncbi:hypothetical protein ACIPW5_38670 [Streptomyces sp. NPDC090077]|uniref:hypothetical protein n=1 Tax=Streptomyces sp. NPDC090077 TaxID=3365938 RepID=UPI0038220A5A